jgi:hypothetical protein
MIDEQGPQGPYRAAAGDRIAAYAYVPAYLNRELRDPSAFPCTWKKSTEVLVSAYRSVVAEAVSPFAPSSSPTVTRPGRR